MRTLLEWIAERFEARVMQLEFVQDAIDEADRKAHRRGYRDALDEFRECANVAAGSAEAQEVGDALTIAFTPAYDSLSNPVYSPPKEVESNAAGRRRPYVRGEKELRIVPISEHEQLKADLEAAGDELETQWESGPCVCHQLTPRLRERIQQIIELERDRA